MSYWVQAICYVIGFGAVGIAVGHVAKKREHREGRK